MADEHKIRVEVLTPEGQVFDGEVAMVSTRTKTGSLGILANHAPLMAMLDPTELALYDNKDDGLNANRAERDPVRAGRGLPPGRRQPRAACWSRRRSRRTRWTAARSSRSSRRRKRGADEAEEGSEARARFERDVKRYEAFLSVLDE